MCEYTEIEKMVLSNGKTVKQINTEVSKEIERIFWKVGERGLPYHFGITRETFI